jgi:RND family efflux transporter MFP subunit
MPTTRLLLILLSAGTLAACSRDAAPEAAAAAAETPPVQVAVDQIAVADSALVENGPVLSGTLTADRTAQLRAQVGGTITMLRAEEGMTVKAGELLAVIDTLAIADQARSAQLGVRSAEAAAATARRNRERSEELFRAGAIAERDVEAARNAALSAEAMLEDARARLASARKQLEFAMVRAPFTGVVSAVGASVGDVVQAGPGSSGSIATVVDPAVLELGASVPAEHLGELAVGKRVEFSVPAHPGEVFRGTIARVNPSVDPATGQVRLYAHVANRDGRLAAGLFAEGRVTLASTRAIAVPLTALDPRATTPSVKRVRGGVVESVPVTLGLRDDLAERVEVTAGIARGDTLLVGGSIGTPVGSRIAISRPDR